jgi:hypothetical protein
MPTAISTIRGFFQAISVSLQIVDNEGCRGGRADVNSRRRDASGGEESGSARAYPRNPSATGWR